MNEVKYIGVNPDEDWMTSKPIAIVDIDGVLYDWCESINLERRVLGKVRIDWTEFRADDNHGTPESNHQLHHEYAQQIYTRNLRIEHGLSYEMQRLSQMTDIAFVTARPYAFAEWTIDFLDELMQEIPYVLQFSTNKANADWMNPQFAIDDHPEHVGELLSISSMRFVALRNHAYNRQMSLSLNGPHGAIARRINWFHEFVDRVAIFLDDESSLDG